ncbi:MAG TPA: nickel-responsive transcriptional regulator NikR [Halothiobacillus sp.]|jgi:CopG family nickel-responsive transcriptional regulator|nr:nickel-responsive transcriptional regulator NikR [Halothiobacillus sp.]
MNDLNKGQISRISISLPARLLGELDRMVTARGYESRSQAIVEMINQQLVEYKRELGQDIMAGTITLVYDHSTPGLQKQLADLQHRYIDEVISSLHVHLMQNQTMEVILVQGPANKLQWIADQMLTCGGVITGRLQLTTTQIPPLHPLP